MAADVERLKTGQAPAGIPVSPVSAPKPVVQVPGGAPKAPAPPTAGITIPSVGAPPAVSGGGMGKKLLLGAVVLVVVIVLIYFVSSLFGGGEPAPTETPTAAPTAAPTLRPTTRGLDSYFGLPSGTLDLSAAATQADIRARLAELVPAAEQGRRVELRNTLSFAAIAPTTVSAGLGTETGIIVFGQNERFGNDGLPLSGQTPEARIIEVFEVADASATGQGMQSWETASLVADLHTQLDYDPAQSIVSGFTDATYRTVPVRYWNFPYADRSVDWAIVPASNGKNYLVIAGSRQGMFFATDQLLK